MTAYPLTVDHTGTALAWVPGTGYRPATVDEIAADAERMAAPPLLHTKPVKPRPTSVRVVRPWDYPPETVVPAGRYAVEINGTLRFFRVSESGRVLAQHADNLLPVSTAYQEQAAQLISVDPRAALVRYGREIGRCGVCGIELTNDVSRAEGIGPVCAGRVNPTRSTR